MTAIETVTAFLSEFGKGKAAMQAAFRTYFTPDSVWENVGLATTTGVDQALALMDQFEASMGTPTIRVEILAIAAQGDLVLTERIDYLLDAEGRDKKGIRLMGIFRVEGERILLWRDYFDTAAFANAEG